MDHQETGGPEAAETNTVRPEAAGPETAGPETAGPQAAQNGTPEQDESAARRAFVKNDVLDFMERYPGFDADGLEALENNEQFRRFCGTRYAREPLAQLYGDYLSVIGGAGAAAVCRANSRSARSTGGGTTGGAALSSEQRRALERWNEANPEMAMTAKEYLNG